MTDCKLLLSVNPVIPPNHNLCYATIRDAKNGHGRAGGIIGNASKRNC